MATDTSDIAFQISVIFGVTGPFDMERFERLAVTSGLVEAYDQAYQSAKERLLRCQELVQEGNRREAWTAATAEPDLRDEVKLLTFPDRRKWVQTCERMGIIIEAALGTDAITNLLEGIYGGSQQLEQLLSLHRRMSMGLAPIAKRLHVLRRIYKQDPKNDSWQEDIRSLEVARAEEMAKESLAADKAGDLPALEALLVEFQSADWSTSPPAKFVKGVERIIQPHRKRFARQRFDELNETLRDKYAALDEKGCREVFESIRQVSERTGAKPHGDLAEQIESVETWLLGLETERNEDSDFKERCDALEAVIDGGADRQTLEKLAAWVLRFDRGMPELLAAQVNSRLEELNRQDRRKFAFRLTSAVVALLLIAGAVTALVMWRSRVAERTRWEQQIAAALEKDDLTGAGKLLDEVTQQDAASFQGPEIQALFHTYAKKVEAETARREDLREALAEVAKAGLDKPDTVKLNRAAELARTYEEKSVVQQWQQRIAARQSELQGARLREFDKGMAELQKLSMKLPATARSSAEEFFLLADRCLERANGLLAMSDITDERRGRAEDLRKHVLERIEELRDKAKRQAAISDTLKSIRLMCARPKKLSKALRDFSATYQEHRYAAEFLKAERMGSGWQAAEAWTQLAQPWLGDVRVGDGVEARTRLREVEKFLAARAPGVCPYEPAAKKYVSYLRTASSAMPGKVLASIYEVEDALKSGIIANAKMVVNKRNGDRYYLVGTRLRSHSPGGRILSYSFFYVVGGNMPPRQKSLKVADMMYTELRDAPQALFAKEALKLISKVKDANGRGWETLCLQLAELVRTWPDIDPVPRAILLKIFLRGAAACVPEKQDQVRPLLAQLSALRVVSHWMDPEGQGVLLARERAAEVVNAIKPLGPIIKEIDEELEAMAQALVPCQPVGILLGRAEDLRLNVPADKGTLCVIWSEMRTGSRFERIGIISEGKIVLDAKAEERYPQGSPIYLRAR